MRVRDVITQVRNIVQDTDATKYRYPDAMLVGYVNMAVQSIAVARPDLFACLSWQPLNDGSVTVRAPRNSIRVIEVNNTRVLKTSATYVDCDDNGDTNDEYWYGPVLAEIDVKQLNRATPGWRRKWQKRTVTNKPDDPVIIQLDMIPREYARNVRNPDTIFIHPGIPTGVMGAQIEMEYACSPRVITLEEVTGGDTKVTSTIEGYEDEMVYPDEIELLPDSYFPIVVDGSIFLVEAMEDEAVNSRRAEVFLNKFNAALGITASSRILTDTLRAGLPEGSVVNLNTSDRVN